MEVRRAPDPTRRMQGSPPLPGTARLGKGEHAACPALLGTAPWSALALRRRPTDPLGLKHTLAWQHGLEGLGAGLPGSPPRERP